MRGTGSSRVTRLPQQPPRLVEGPRVDYYAQPERPRYSFWRISLHAIPIVAALVSTGLLAYFVLGRSQPFSQFQLPPQVVQTPVSGPSVAQELAQNEKPTPVQAQPTQQVQLQEIEKPRPKIGPALPIPNDNAMVVMIMSSVVALSQANATENYTVLHGMGAPSFQELNSPERLSKIFAKLRSRKLDLSPVLLFAPKLYRKPEITPQGLLRITGFFPTKPVRINFDLMFQTVDDQWRLFGISVKPAPEPQPTNRSTPQVKEDAGVSKPAQAKAEPQAMKPPPPKPKKPVEAPKPAGTTAGADIDVRDRIEKQPPAPAPAPPKPEKKGFWNPFSR